MHGYSCTCIYFYLQVQRCLMHMSQVFSCSRAIVLLASLQFLQLPQPINNAVCAINIDDAAPRTVDINAVAIIAASPHLKMLHPLLRITVVSTCYGYILHPLAVDILLPLLWYFCPLTVGIMLHPLAVDILLPLLWYFLSTCCGYYAVSTCCGYYAASTYCEFTAATAVVICPLCARLPLLWISPPGTDSSVI